MTKNIIYLIACKCCDKQYIGSATGFVGKGTLILVRLGVYSGHLLNVCKSVTCKTENLPVQRIEHVLVREGEDADKVLWKREKYCQAQHSTLTHGLNKMNESYELNRRGYRK